MVRKIMFLACAAWITLSAAAYAQNDLDARPLDPEKDPDIDMFMGSWQNSRPFNTHGSITERAILTRCTGDPLKPARKGAVLTIATRFSRATIDPRATTAPTTLKGEQEVFYFTSGTGIIKTSGKTADIHDGVFVLVPEGLEFTIANTSDGLLEMYLIVEPVPQGFTPKKDIVVKDEKTMPFRDQGYLKVHWSHNGKNIFNQADGLATLTGVNCLAFEPMTIGQPHSHGPGLEEVWTVVSGKNLAFLGKEIRWQPPGTAYKIPPTGTTPHSNINCTEEPIKFLYFSKL